uniref:Vesicle-fusing ATPase n=1 Tax=Cryptocotyle lingua TaxID=66766 RepID=A0A7U0TIA9_9TREM|nr:vesicle-fusing ATPase 2 [Cryptocotyle lingua]
MAKFLATKAPNEELSLSNRVYFNPRDFQERWSCISVHTAGNTYIFRAAANEGVPVGKVAFGLVQRKWGNISVDEPLDVRPYSFNLARECLGAAVLAVDFNNKKTPAGDPLDADHMAREFSMQFADTPLTVGQPILFKFNKKLLLVDVQKLTTMSMDRGEHTDSKIGILTGNTVVTWERQPDSKILLIGKAVSTGSTGGGGYQSIINPNWDFNQMGIGGLDKEFAAIFRRTFASRMFPPAVGKQLGLKHVRGMLLYGPPGTGKTLMARQIGKMLNAREPKIVNGPSILDKYVGESEANIRKLFADAEEEEKRMGPHSALHIIIFDEIDAICKTRGSTTGGAGVHDTVVNQLLTKMDGVEQLNNILIIGMTNRLDMIDEALLRPGRFEMQLEISLPDEEGRLQILQIHTAKMRQSGKVAKDVSLEELAAKTKNFSGAEIEGLCRAAAFTAMYQLISHPRSRQPSGKTQLDPDAFDRLLVKRADFLYALENDIKPAFGTAEEELSCYAPRGIMTWGESVSEALNMGRLAVRAVGEADVETRRPLTLLLEGPPKAGKTALAVEIAKLSGFPFIKIVTSHKMIGYTEMAKCATMKKIFDDGAKSPLSVVIVDNIEGLIEYNPVGPRFSNFMVQAIRDLVSQPLKAGRRMLVLATTSCRAELTEQNLTQAFSWHIHVSVMTKPEHIMAALEEDDRFTPVERQKIERSIAGSRFCIGIKHLIELVDLVSKTDPDYRVPTFLAKLEEEGTSAKL